MMLYDIAVIGGGPAGMMAAIRAAQLGAKVALFEKNKQLGRKLLLTGQGRCNLTNANDLADSLRYFSRTGIFLRDAFTLFFNRELMEFFESRGVGLKVERQNRVFPKSDKAYDILRALERELKRSGVDVFCSSPIDNISFGEDIVFGTSGDGETAFEARRVIIATGGVSYRDTGSTGDGLKMARGSGHEVTALRASLVPLVSQEPWVKKLQGLALKNIRLVICVDGREKIKSDIGELMFTHFGISGPLVLNLSSQISDFLHEGKVVKLLIDLKPALNGDVLEKRLIRDLSGKGRMNIRNILKDYLPQRMGELFLSLLSLDGRIEGNQFPRNKRADLVKFLKKLPLTITRTLHVEEAMVTKGGVSIKDIDPKTMRSRKEGCVYFSGEVIDVDAITGGYNLQAAFSTGYLAGDSAARSLR